MDLDLKWYPALFGTGLIAGFVDAVAGGGGLLTVPVLLATGLPVPMALGTNKVQSSCGTALATVQYARSGLIQLSTASIGMIFTSMSAGLGAYALSHIKPEFIRPVIPLLLFGIAGYTLFRPNLGKLAGPARMPPILFAASVGMTLGFYDGFFGPGTGAFWALACVTLAGMDLLRATAYTKAMNLTSNLVSAVVLISYGKIDWGIAATMACGQVLGGTFGARTAVRGGVRLIRPIFLTMVFLLATRTAWQYWINR